MEEEKAERWLKHELSLANYSIGAGVGIVVFLYANIDKLTKLPSWSHGFTMLNLLLIGIGIILAVFLRVTAANVISGFYLAPDSPEDFIRPPLRKPNLSFANTISMLFIISGVFGLAATVFAPILLSEMYT